jgi:cobalt/nickel transport system ATP-binding protein
MSAPLFQLENVTFGYGDRTVLEHVDLVLRPGDRIGVDGAIGSGKTSLLHLLVGLARPSAGRVEAFGRIRQREDDFHEVRRRAGLVFQDPDDQLFCPSVVEDVAFGPLNLGHGANEARAIAEAALERVGLPGFGDRITYKLSGGEKRLVALATVLAMEPEVLLLDEPTASLDEASRQRMADVIEDLPQSMIVVSHIGEFLARVTNRRVVLHDGRIGEV